MERHHKAPPLPTSYWRSRPARCSWDSRRRSRCSDVTPVSPACQPHTWPRELVRQRGGRPTDRPPRPGRSGSGRSAGFPHGRRPAKGRTGPQTPAARTTQTGLRERPLNAGDQAKHVGKSRAWSRVPCVWKDGGTQSQVHTSPTCDACALFAPHVPASLPTHPLAELDGARALLQGGNRGSARVSF